MVRLAATLGPVFALYPLLWLSSTRLLRGETGKNEAADAHLVLLQQQGNTAVGGLQGWYYWLCLEAVERSGAAVIKLLQWASGRPDMFGHEFCSVFSKLQDDTKPHRWKHTERMLQDAFGENWREKIELFEILGSGCIGQVYRGHLKATDERVAVKVMHPNVRDDIDADLDIMRLAVRATKYIPFDMFANLRWLNMEGIVEEFAALLKLQIDLRREAANLQRFNENFRDEPSVEFPKLVPGLTATENVLVETYCEGIPVLQFCRDNRGNQAQLTDLCRKATKAVCKMIFLDNFVHGTK
jgi:aarF domain-containing kinase